MFGTLAILALVLGAVDDTVWLQDERLLLIDAVVDASRVGGAPVLLPLVRTITLVYDLFRLPDTLYP